jgi:hypothetical protein
MHCLFICLCYLFPIATVRHRRLQESPGAQRSRLWAAASGRARHVTESIYVTQTTIGIQFAHLPWRKRATRSGRRGGGSVDGWRRWRCSLVKLRLREAALHLPRDLLFLLGQFNGSNWWRQTQIWWQLGFGGFWVLRAKIHAMGCASHLDF